jgi:hypothetical protein
MRHAFSLALGLFVTAPLVEGCKAEQDQSPPLPSSPTAARCVKGVQRAVKAPTGDEASSIYYEECADLFTMTPCRDAFRAAAKAPPAEQFTIVATACRKAYCPTLTAFAFDICRDDFAITPESLARAWPPLFDAIISREAGASTPEVSNAMLTLYAKLHAMPTSSAAAPSGAAPSGAPSGSGVPAGSAAGSAAPAGRVPAAVPAGSAHGAVVAKETKAKPASSQTH